GPVGGAATGGLGPSLGVLEIQRPGRRGRGGAGELTGHDRPEIIFLTAYDQHAVDAFDVEAADYLLKPLRLDRLRQAVERARRRLRSRMALAATPDVGPEAAWLTADGAAFWVQGRDGLIRIPFSSIDWIEAARDYVLLHGEGRAPLLRATMAALEARLPGALFMRVHRSAFVRLAAVAGFQPLAPGGAALSLHSGGAVPVGPSYLPAVRARFGA
ncbi:MAG: LytTR family DNA-binding domain-containing protein, partial [Brevundimonas sp.]|nr:LytTR family DNA-binding domain-containing protein [Brevundimonas sp.]